MSTVDGSTRGKKPRGWLSVAIASLIAAPVGALGVAVIGLLVAFDWAGNNTDLSNLLPLVLGGFIGGLGVGFFARLRDVRLLVPALAGAVIGLGYFYLLFDGSATDSSELVKILAIYLPLQAIAYFLVTWAQIKNN